MEKLLRLLNIYSQDLLETNLRFTYDGNNLRVQGDEIGPYVAESIVINKKFLFIERLVNNDKIDFDKVNFDEREVGMDMFSNFYKKDIVIMRLSIQDNPIEYLCKIIKE